MSKILVLGAGGYIGTALFNYYASKNNCAINSSVSNNDVIFTNQRYEYGLIKELFNKGPFEAVINCIGRVGVNNVDWCETHQSETIYTNAIVPEMIAIECADLGLHMTHISSGCIFNDGMFEEGDTPNMDGQCYAATKIEAERRISNMGNVLTVRIRMPIDHRSHKRNLICKLLPHDKVMDVPNSMTVLDDAIPVLDYAISKGITGKMNLVNEGTISSAEIMGLYDQIVEPHEFGICEKVETAAPRSNCQLINGTLKERGIEMPNIKTSVIKTLCKMAATK